MIVTGDYFLNVKLGGVPIVTDMRNLEYLNIFMDIDKLLPCLVMRIQDAGSVLTQLVSGDKKSSVLSVGFQSVLDKEYREYDFRIVKRVPEGDWSSSVFKVYGILDLPGFFKDRSRSFEDMYWKDIFLQIVREVGVTEAEVDERLGYKVDIVQPFKSNAWFLNYLKDKLGEYFLYFVLKGKEVVFKVMSLTKLLRQSAVKKLVLGDRVYQDAYPFREYEFVEDGGFLSMFGMRGQVVSYWDYEKGEYREEKIEAEECLSLTPYVLVDKTEKDYSFCFLGRVNDVFNIKKIGEGKFKKKLINMTHVWVSTDPVFDIIPGDIVEIECLQGLLSEVPVVWRMSGKWLVKRVVYQFGVSVSMRMLLSRSGIETDDETVSLIEGRRV